ncbi:hypothetical protein HAX54_039060, partial [Datura stramonium]|nr:hypothetical protein [Datura stramonium]
LLQKYPNSRATSVNSRMEDMSLPVPLEERLSVETLTAVLINYNGDDFQGYIEM